MGGDRGDGGGEDDEFTRTRVVWPMYLFVAILLGIGVALFYVFVFNYWREGIHRIPGVATCLVVLAPFGAAGAAFRAAREQAKDDAARAAAHARPRAKLDKREKLAPHPVEPAGRAVADGPFRGAPRAAPIVAHVHGATPVRPAPVVAPAAGTGDGPKLLT